MSSIKKSLFYASAPLNGLETPASDEQFTALDLVAAQEALEDEAGESMPFQFNSCTYDLGYIKQAVYSCQTCLNHAGICGACAISCHGEHDLVELFMRRDFRCDCGTSRMGAGSVCSISKRNDAKPNPDNKYSRNFMGEFCNCGVPYDPHTETDSMYQCLVCEDWMHHKCLFGSHSDDNISPLNTDDFDMLICDKCVRQDLRMTSLLDRWAGVEGTGVMVIDEHDKVLGNPAEGIKKAYYDKLKEEEEQGASLTAEKRKSDDQESQPIKKIKTETGSSNIMPTNNSCKAPPKAEGESIFTRLKNSCAKLNIYLFDGWQERWCRCKECTPSLPNYPYFLEIEESYEPPEDPDAGKTTFQLGMEAFEKMPREQAIDGARAFNELSVRLREFLRPRAESGQVVTKGMVEEFFLMERQRKTKEM